MWQCRLGNPPAKVPRKIRLLGWLLGAILLLTPMATGFVVDGATWLTISVWMEARGESWEGKLGVAWAHVNRMRDSRWPDTIGDVVWQSRQFSWTNPGDSNRMHLDELRWDDPVVKECHRAAVTALSDPTTPDPTKGANHYVNPKAVRSLPGWYRKDKVTAVLGAHEFLKL